VQLSPQSLALLRQSQTTSRPGQSSATRIRPWPPAKSYSGFKHVRWRVLRIDAKLLGMAQRAAEAEGHMLCSEARFLRDFRLP
jgi:hypothetical protein